MYPLSERFGNLVLALGSIGRLSGIVAAVLFCQNMILATRIPVFEDLFGGLNKVYIAHHLLGGLALCVLLMHPITLALRLTPTSLRAGSDLLIPFVANFATTLGILALWIFIGLMVVTFYISLPYRIWLITHKFLGVVLLLMVLHIALVSSDTNSNPSLRLYLYAMLALAAAAFVYRTLLPRFFVRHYNYEVANVAEPTKGVVTLTMVPKGRRIDFKAGQFVFVSFRSEGLSHEWHPFSISSNSNAEGLAITVKSLGSYTKTLVSIANNLAGQEVMIEGAYGRFSFKNFHSKRQIWIAGGIGITPFLSMASDVGSDYKVDLYYSVKSQAELIDWDYLSGLVTKSNGALRVIPIIADEVGFLDAAKISEHSGDISNAEVLLCGPPPMMAAMKGQISKMGIKKSKIHSEEFAMS